MLLVDRWWIVCQAKKKHIESDLRTACFTLESANKDIECFAFDNNSKQKFFFFFWFSTGMRPYAESLLFRGGSQCCSPLSQADSLLFLHTNPYNSLSSCSLQLVDFKLINKWIDKIKYNFMRCTCVYVCKRPLSYVSNIAANKTVPNEILFVYLILFIFTSTCSCLAVGLFTINVHVMP